MVTRIFLLLVCASAGVAGEIDPIKVALIVDGMASRGSGYEASELHGLGVDGLTAILDHLLPDTAQPMPPMPKGPPEEDIRRLVKKLDADDFSIRESATELLIAQARHHKRLIEAALASDSLDVRMRAERVLASWESAPAERLSAYLSGFWAYVEGLDDRERLELLANRTLKAFEQGMPEGDRLHLLRLCIAGVAHGREDASCDILLPLVRHTDVRIAALTTETVGAYKTEPRFVPRLLVEALASQRQPVVEAALRFVVDCRDEQRRGQVQRALRMIFEQREEPLKFQACLPLLREFRDPEAWTYVLDQTASKDPNRVRTAFNWIGDTKHCGQAPPEALAARIHAILKSGSADQRRAATAVLGIFSGEPVVRQLIHLLADSDSSVARQADASLLAQPDRSLVQRLLKDAAAKNPQPIVRSRAGELLARMPQS